MRVASLCRVFCTGFVAFIAACGAVSNSVSLFKAEGEVFEGPVPRADCGPGSKPEQLVQGEQPPDEEVICNLEIVGHEGTTASWQMAYYEDCAYYDQDFPADAPSQIGTVVVDASDPTKPVESARLTSPAMLDPHESLTVHQQRALLGGVAGWDALGNGPAYFDLYDVTECADPQPLASLPVNTIGHEGDFSPDGNTYYATYPRTAFTAIDVTEPTRPLTLMTRPVTINHGLSVSADGNRLYLSQIATGPIGNGFLILDVSQVQARRPAPQIETITEFTWADGATAQHTIPVTIGGKPHLIAVDEAGRGAARIVDITDETAPRMVSKLKLELHIDPTTSNSVGNNNAHYCGVDRLIEPTVVGCGYTTSGLRVFDIRNPLQPREIAYFNHPGAQMSSRVRFIPERAEVWFTDQGGGFWIARFTNGVWPFK